METKQKLREKIWKLLERKKAARFPGARGRIPNFVGAEECARWLNQVPEWNAARVIKSNPDSPQRQVRRQALKEGKVVYMAVPRLAENKPFIELDPARLKDKIHEASSIKGAFRWGRPVEISKMKGIDLVVCGSVAVNRKGERIGKGEGYSELEFALTVEAGILSANVAILTSVHPLQIISESVQRKPHDFAVDYILTPDELIDCPKDQKRPKGIYWNEINDEKIRSIPVLARLKERGRRS